MFFSRNGFPYGRRSLACITFPYWKDETFSVVHFPDLPGLIYLFLYIFYFYNIYIYTQLSVCTHSATVMDCNDFTFLSYFLCNHLSWQSKGSLLNPCLINSTMLHATALTTLTGSLSWLPFNVQVKQLTQRQQLCLWQIKVFSPFWRPLHS